jgi:hypothetical protein
MKKYIINALVITVVLGVIAAPLHAAKNKTKAKAKNTDTNAAKQVDPNAPGKTEPNAPVKSMAKFVASKDRPTFHKADCKFAKKIDTNDKVEYTTREDAIKAGKQPCKVCKP